MSNPLYRQLMPTGGNPLLQQILNFRNGFNGNPQQIIQEMLNSGRITQEQVNQYAQQANEIYRQMRNIL